MLQLHSHRESLGFNGKSMYLKIHNDILTKMKGSKSSFNQSLYIAQQHVPRKNIHW